MQTCASGVARCCVFGCVIIRGPWETVPSSCGLWWSNGESQRMRVPRRIRVFSGVAAALAVCIWAGAALAGGPGDVYNDFVADGKLSCNHSRGDLEAAAGGGLQPLDDGLAYVWG